MENSVEELEGKSEEISRKQSKKKNMENQREKIIKWRISSGVLISKKEIAIYIIRYI